MSSVTPNQGSRIPSIDQFRGYTIAGMILVNFVGDFSNFPEFFKHHDTWMSYADTIAPIFLFVAGMGFRLSLMRNAEKLGVRRAMLIAARRYAILTLIGVLYYSPVDWRQWWDALVDIGIAGLLALPFMLYSGKIRVAAAFGYMAIYQALLSGGYFTWVMNNSYDGGPLGPLSWVFCLLLGSVAYDLIATRDMKKIVTGCLAWGILLSALGWGLRAEWPGLKEFWPFSQTSMAPPYPLYATGLAFLTYLPFYWLSDIKKIEIPTLTMVGANPLVIYMLHGMYIDIHGTIVPSDSSIPVALLAFFGLYMGCYGIARYLYTNRMFIKIG